MKKSRYQQKNDKYNNVHKFSPLLVASFLYPALLFFPCTRKMRCLLLMIHCSMWTFCKSKLRYHRWCMGTIWWKSGSRIPIAPSYSRFFALIISLDWWAIRLLGQCWWHEEHLLVVPSKVFPKRNWVVAFQSILVHLHARGYQFCSPIQAEVWFQYFHHPAACAILSLRWQICGVPQHLRRRGQHRIPLYTDSILFDIVPVHLFG